MTCNILTDNPMETLEQDALGYGAFAKHVRRTIDSIEFDESVVLGVTGPWGSGKTTFINFVMQSGDSILHIAKFNPWWFTPTNNLTELFFEKLTFELAKAYPEPPIRALAQKFFTLLRKGKRLIPPIAKGLASGAAVCGGSPESGVIAGEIVEQVAETAIASGDGELSLDEYKEQLIDALSKHSKRILFVIDDIDRLHPSEICELFNTVKIISDLPKITFLLIYERKVVETAISIEYEVDGATYLEKIIQLQFEIPKPDEYCLHQMFYLKLADFIPSRGLDFDEWHVSLSSLLLPYIRKMRDINRVINTLTMTYPPVKNEVNFFDFLTMTFLYLFERTIHGIIYENPEKFHCFRYQMNIKPDEQFIEHSLEEVDPSRRTHILKILHKLFPVLTKQFAPSDINTWRKELRIAAPENFIAYFAYSVPKHLLSQVDVMRFMNAAQNGYEEAIGFMKEWLDNGPPFASKISRLFKHLMLLDDSAFTSEQIENTSRALLLYGDIVSNHLGIKSNDIFNSLIFSSAAYHFLSKIGDEESVEKIILTCIPNSQSINLLMHVDHLLSPGGRSYAAYNFKKPERSLNIKNAIAAKIEALSEAEFLDIHWLRNTVQILWSYDRGVEAIKCKIKSILASETALLKFLELCLQTRMENLDGLFDMNFIITDLKLFAPSLSEGIAILSDALQTWECDTETSQNIRLKVERMLELAKNYIECSDE